MPANLAKLAAIRRAVKRLIKAERAYGASLMTGQDLEIERELERARSGYERAMRQLAEAT